MNSQDRGKGSTRERIDTVIVGAGQSGLAVAYYLKQQGRSHVLLERKQVAEAWRNGKWDSFTLVSPNWSLDLPGFAYVDNDPDGFLTRDEVVRYVESYARFVDAPIRTGVEVKAVRALDGGFLVETSEGTIEAAHVVVATGAFQNPRIPAFAASIPSHIVQVHSSAYRNPHQLPDGAVLVVGSGQSGCQIAEELYKSGRKVYLSTGRAGRLPRRFRGRDAFRWVQEMGMLDQTVETLASPDERFEANPLLTGKDGGYTHNLHRFALDGVILLGRCVGAEGTVIRFAPNLMENLAFSDDLEEQFLKGVHRYLAATGQADESAYDEFLAQRETPLRAGYDCAVATELDLDAAGIVSIVWAAGYAWEYSWIHFPIFDERGYPLHERGVTSQPGLYFIGLLWLHKSKSNLFLGVGEDAAYIAAHIAETSAV